MSQPMPLPLTVSCFSKIQIGSTFLVPAHPGSPGQRVVKRVYVCVLIAKFHYTDTGPTRTRTRTDPTEFRRKKVRVRVVEFSY